MVVEFLDNDLKACMDMSKTPFSIAEVSERTGGHEDALIKTWSSLCWCGR